MKKINSLGLVLLMLLCTGLSASALKVTFQWDIPGSVSIRSGSLSGDVVELEPGATSYTVVTEGTTAIPYTYFFPNEGYVLTTVELPNGQKQNPSSNVTYGQYWGRNFTSGYMSGWGEDPVVKVGCKKLERNDVVTIDIENGAKCVSAELGSLGYSPELHDGVNTVKFDASVENSMTFYWVNGASDFYSMTLNGNKVTTKPNQFSSYVTLNNIKNGDKIVIKVFDNPDDVPEDVVLTVELSEALKDCISSVRNWTNSTFVELVDGKLTLTKGTDIGFNFIEGYTFTKFTLGSEDISGKYIASQNRLRFVVNETATLKIEGAPAVYNTVEFNAYVMNPEGVDLKLGKYSAAPAELGEGDAVTADVELNGYTFEASKAKHFRLDVQENTPYVYVAPKDGWFITTVQAKENGSFWPISSANEDTKTFYVIAEPLRNTAKMKVQVTGNSTLRLAGNAAKSASWDNPELSFFVAEGDNTVSFCPGYSSPFTLRCIEAIDNFEVYLDGFKLTLDEEFGNYSIAPYAGSDKESVVTVFASGTSSGKIVTTTVTCEGIDATATYGGALTYPIAVGDEDGTKYLRNTPTTITPASSNCTISLNGTVVYGIDENGNSVGSLNEDGSFVFTPTTAIADVVVKASKFVKILSIDPADGSIVKTLSSVKLTVPSIGDESMLNTSNELLAGIKVSKADGTVVEETFELGEPGMDETYTNFVFPVIFSNPLVESGEYTISIPEGTFCETAWNDDAEEFVKVEDGFVTAPLNISVTVDPSVKAPIENFVITPASGSALKSLGAVYVDFPDFTPYDMSLQLGDEAIATFTNGTETRTAEINQNWAGGNCRSFMIVLMDSNYEDDPITAEGEWRLTIPAGAFTCNGELSPVIEAEYKIGQDFPAYPITPTPGAVTGDLSKFIISFPGAESVAFNEYARPITLVGENFSARTSYVSETTNANEFKIEFNELPTVAGMYTLTIPAGWFNVNEMDCEEISATFMYEPIWKLTPAPGSEVENLNELTLEFPKAATAEFIGFPSSFVLTNNSTYASPGFECAAVEGAEHPTFKLTMSAGVSQPPLGEISFIINDETFMVDGEPCPEVRVNYVIDHEVSSDYQVDPPSRKIVYSSEAGAYWTFIFDEAATVFPANYSQVASNIVVKLDGEALAYSTDYFVSFETNMILMGIINLDILKPGTLTVDIDEGAILLHDEPLPAIHETFTLEAPKDYTFTTDPADNAVVNSIKEITVAFPEAESGELFNENGISLTRGYEFSSSDITVTPVEGAECATFKLVFGDAPEASSTPAAYTFACRKGSFTLDGLQESPELSVSFVLDANAGVSGIEVSADGKYSVVTLDGCVILLDASYEKVRDLPAGFYIINGRKAIVK